MENEQKQPAAAGPVDCRVRPCPHEPMCGCGEAEQPCQRMRRALHEIAEEWAGAECGEPVYAQEAYAIGLAKRMYALAVEGLKA